MSDRRSRAACPSATVPGVLLACCAAPVILTIDYAVVSVLAPDIRAALGLSDGELAWIFAAYSAGYGAFLLAAGRCADRYGARRVLMGGLALFAAAAVAVATARTPATAIAARAVQGAAAAALFAASLAALSAAHGNAAFAGAIGVGFTVGGLAGGVVAAVGSWRWGVVLTVPCCLAAAALATRIPPVRQDSPTVSWRVALGVGAVVAAGAAGTSLAGLPATAVAAAAIAAFALRRGGWRAAVACSATMVLTGTCVAGTLAIAVLLQADHGPVTTGAALACFGVAALPAVRLAGRTPTVPAAAAALAIQGAALIAAGAAHGGALVAACVAALGFGHVLGNAATADLALGRAEPARVIGHGVVAGTLGSAQRLGGALGPLLLVPDPTGLALGGAAALVAAGLCLVAGRHILVR